MLMVLVLLCLATGALAERMVAFPIDNRYGEDHAMDFVWYKGDILIRNFSGVFRYTPGEVEVEMLFAVNNDGSRYGGRPPFFDGLFGDGDQLCAYERYRGLLAPIALEMDNANMADWVQLKDMYRGGKPRNLFMHGGRLYTVFSALLDRQGEVLWQAGNSFL